MMTGVRVAVVAFAVLGASLSACSSHGSPTASHETPKLPPTPPVALTLSQTCIATEALLREGNMTPGQTRAKIVALAQQSDRKSKNALAQLIIALQDHTDGSAGAVGGAAYELRRRCTAIHSWPHPDQ